MLCGKALARLARRERQISCVRCGSSGPSNPSKRHAHVTGDSEVPLSDPGTQTQRYGSETVSRGGRTVGVQSLYILEYIRVIAIAVVRFGLEEALDRLLYQASTWPRSGNVHGT